MKPAINTKKGKQQSQEQPAKKKGKKKSAGKSPNGKAAKKEPKTAFDPANYKVV